jgi:RHS repeat-associated protein
LCEITGATGSGTCAQTSSQTGYWTKYVYDANNKLTSVTQNAQSSTTQSRSYAYDGLGRIVSEANPESGTTTYTYDTDSTCGTSDGDLVKKIDAAGNTTCYSYDALHRVTSTTYSGTYASVTPSRNFVYDAAIVNSVTMVNTKSRMAEAYTCFSPCSTKLTDIGFSYTVRGQVSDVYESTPHSGTYYHVNQTYWAHGAIEQLSGLSGLPTITYGLDGEGRIYSASASSGQNPLSSTIYNTSSSPTQVNLGSSDNDSFMYDPNTNRMTQYSFNVGSQSVVGIVGWNALGTPSSLAITDPFNSADAQTCSYSHDDLTRIASVNCGSVWSQTFSYDAFGNLSKSGSMSFQPTYSATTNQMTSIGSSTPTYDLDGNVENDFLHTYSWDANSRPVTVDGVNLTFDALGRMVEQNRSGTYTEIVYSPSGARLALMSGASLQKGYVPLTGGSMVVYNSTGLAYYRHSDWIGSSRLASTSTRTVYFDGAYGPFGEPYAQSGTNDLSFTGMNQDTVSNLYDFAAREYGIQGRWPSPDPAGVSSVCTSDPQTWNRYAYVRNSPLFAFDPNGMVTLTAPMGGGGGGGGAISLAALGIGMMYGGVSSPTDAADYDADFSMQSWPTATDPHGTSVSAVSDGEAWDEDGAVDSDSSPADSTASAPQNNTPQASCYSGSYPASIQYNGSTVDPMSAYPGADEGDLGIFIANSYTLLDQNQQPVSGATILETWSDQSYETDTDTGPIISTPGNQTNPVIANGGTTNPDGTFLDSPVGGYASPTGSAVNQQYGNVTAINYSWTQTLSVSWGGCSYSISSASTSWNVVSSAPGTGSISGTGLASVGLSRP